MAFFVDKVTSSVQRLTRRVGGGTVTGHGISTSSNCATSGLSKGPGGHNDNGDEQRHVANDYYDDPQRPTTTIRRQFIPANGGAECGERYRMEKRNLLHDNDKKSSSSASTSSKNSTLNNNSRSLITINKTEEWRSREKELNEMFRRKLDALRQRLLNEKSREIDALATNLKKKHNNELGVTIKRKEKEMNALRTQLRKSQEQLLERSRSAVLVNAVSQDSLKSTRSQDYSSHSRSRASVDLANLREQISDLQQTIKRNELDSKRKDVEIRTSREQHEAEIQRIARDAQRHIKALLEELQQKDRKIDKLERQLRSSSSAEIRTWRTNVREDEQHHRNLNPNSSDLHKRRETTSAAGANGQEQQEEQQQLVIEMKQAGSASSMSSSRSGLGPPVTIAREEYEKEKQRWQQKMSDLEASLKKSEESNAELSQSKAEMIRKNKDMEKVKKSLEEFNKKLCDRQKILTQETRQLEQKLKEAQDEAIRSTQASDTVTLECNRLKEKRYNPDRDEELDRLRQQNLEYCKCISALKQTILEKDRRLEVLQQKLRRSKRCRSSTMGGERSDDENAARSVNELDFSASSMSLDTINEDYGEATKEELEVSYRQLANEHLELQNICSSLMRQVNNSDGVGDGRNQQHQEDLRNRLQQALLKIIQLERTSSSPGAAPCGPDAAYWTREKAKFAALIRAMGEKIRYLELDQERLQQELASAKEENELLEFQVLELEQSQSEADYGNFKNTTSTVVNRSAISQCDRSVSTSEDEGHFSMDHSMEEGLAKELSLEELKIRFTLLKHRKELRPDERNVVAQVKDLWESVQNEHSFCASKLIESEMKLRDTEATLLAKMEEWQREKEEMSPKQKKKLKAKELQCELDSAKVQLLKLQEENATLKTDLDASRANESQLRLLYTSLVESEERERMAASALRKQLGDIAASRRAEADLLAQASRQQAQNATAMCTKISDLEKEIDQLKTSNRSLSSELAAAANAQSQSQTAIDFIKEEELDRLRKMNAEYQESLGEYKKMESCWTEQRQTIERKYADVKSKFKEAMKLIKEYEQNITKYSERLKEAAKEKVELAKTNAEREKRVAELERELGARSRSGNGLSRDDFIACKEVEEQLKAMLKEKTKDLEEKCVLERKLTDDKSKLQKQLQHVKSYSAQLEKQFEMQIQIVQALKVQLQDLQKVTREKDSTEHVNAAHDLLALFLPSTYFKIDSPSSCYCRKFASTPIDQRSVLRELAAEIWNALLLVDEAADDESRLEQHVSIIHKTCVRLHSVNDSMERIIKDAKDDFAKDLLEPLKRTCCAAIFYNERLSKLYAKVEDLEKSTTLFKEEADKANARADMILQKQYHDELLLRRGGDSADSQTPIPPELLALVYQDLRNALEQMRRKDNNNEAIVSFRSKLAQFLLTICEDRTISPSEQCGSGTESEVCDRSPIFSRKRRSVNGCVGGSSFRSTCSDDAASSTDFQQQTPSVSADHHQQKNSVLLPAPSNVRLAADLRNGRYLVCWSPPEDLSRVKGYKVYVKGELKKHVCSPHCAKAVIECAEETDWTRVSVIALYDDGVESIAANIDVEKSRKFINAVGISIANKCTSEKRENHDENGSDDKEEEECSEV